MLYLLLTLILVLPDIAGSVKPNIVFILQDDLGHYDTGIYGNKEAEAVTTHITSLSKEGVILNNHYVHWHCSPTRRSFLTGRLPLHHGEELSQLDTDDMDLRWTWISEKLQKAGYVSHWYGKGHTGYKSMNHLPARRGFNGGSVFFLAGSGSYTTLARWNGTEPLVTNHEYSTDLFGSLAVEAVKNHDTTKPLFLYLPFQAVHTPYDLPQTCTKAPYSKRISCLINDADRWIGELVTALKKKDMYENTLIVYAADNGGVGDGNNYPLRGEKHTNWQGGMQAAAFVSGGLVPEALRGTQNNDTFHIVDWYPTFAKLAGVDSTDDPPVMPLPVDPSNPKRDIYQGSLSFPPLDGQNIWPALVGSSKTPTRQLWLSAEVLIRGRHKLLVQQPDHSMYNGNETQSNGWKQPNGKWVDAPESKWPCNVWKSRSHPNMANSHPCLFDLSTDPREEHNIANENPQLVQDLWTALKHTQLTAFKSRSPSKLVGKCNEKCAAKKWKNAPGPICDVPGCGGPPAAPTPLEYV